MVANIDYPVTGQHITERPVFSKLPVFEVCMSCLHYRPDPLGSFFPGQNVL